MINTVNAKIIKTFLGIEDHGIFTFSLTLEWAGAGQCAGNYKIGPDYKYCGNAIIAILDTVGVDSWEELRGKLIRIRQDHCKVYAIGNIIEDKWLDFEEFFKGRQEVKDA